MIALIAIVAAFVAGLIAGWMYRGWVDNACIDDTGEQYSHE